MVDAAATLAKTVIGTGYDGLPQAAIEATKLDILDTLASLVAGSSAPGCREIVNLVTRWGGKGESTILVHGHRVPTVWAVLANATMAHALDWDDTHDKAILHAGITVVPVALALSETHRTSGKDFIAAIALGVDISSRMALAAPTGPIQSGWMHSPLYGGFGSAAAGAKIMGFDEDRLINTLGLAYAQACGNTQCQHDGTLAKRLQPGFAAHGAILALEMTEAGITGARNVLEGESGFYKVYYQGRYDPAALTRGLGEIFEIVNLSYKPYPSCRATHPYIDCALKLVKEHDIRPEDIQGVTVFLAMVPHPICHPLETKRNPRNPVDAQFSIPYTVAVALVKRQVGISDFTAMGIADPVVLGIANKVAAELDPELDPRTIPPGRVEVALNDGMTYSAQVKYPKGDPRNPLSLEEIGAKFKEGVRFAARPMSDSQAEKVIETVQRLEDVDDASNLVRLLT